MALTKINIIETVQNEMNYDKYKSVKIIDTLLEVIKKTLIDGDSLLISGFGKFCVNEKNERIGRNPATSKRMTLDKRKVITFKCSSKLREKINK